MSPTHYSLTFSLLAHALLLIPVVSALPDGSKRPGNTPRSVKVTIQRQNSSTPATSEAARAATNESQQTAAPTIQKVDSPAPAVAEKSTTQATAKRPVKAARKLIAATDSTQAKRTTALQTLPKIVKKPVVAKKQANKLAKVQKKPPQPVVERVSTVAESLALDTINSLPVTTSGKLNAPSPVNSHITQTVSKEMAHGRIAEIESLYRSKLEQTIQSAKKYPLWARRKGLQGKTQVGFTVYRDGHIEQVQLIGGSGHSILDKAALVTVNELGSVQPIPIELARQQWTFEVPLHFYLN